MLPTAPRLLVPLYVSHKWVPRISPAGKSGQCLWPLTLPRLCTDYLEILGASTPWSPKGLPRPVMGWLCDWFICGFVLATLLVQLRALIQLIGWQTSKQLWLVYVLSHLTTKTLHCAHVFCLGVKVNRPQRPSGEYSFINLGPRWVVSATLRPLYPRERPGTHCIGGWVGPSCWFERLWKISPPHSDSTPRTVHSVASRYTDWAIPAHLCLCVLYGYLPTHHCVTALFIDKTLFAVTYSLNHSLQDLPLLRRLVAIF